MNHADLLKLLLPAVAYDTRAPNLSAELVAEGNALDAVQRRAVDLLRETDPRTAIELLSDWERAYGLPDPCALDAQSVQQRRAALLQKIVRGGGISRQFFIDLATTLGFNGPPFVEDGSAQAQSALQFNGTNQYGVIAGSASLDAPNAFAVVATVTDLANGLGHSFGRDSSEGIGGAGRIFIVRQDATLTAGLYHCWNSANVLRSFAPPNSWKSGQTFHCVFTCWVDASVGRIFMEVMIDGASVGIDSFPGVAIRTDPTCPLGFSLSSALLFKNQILDGFRYYTRRVTPEEAAAMAAGNYEDATELVVHLPFNEGAGTVASDVSGLGNHASLFNAPTWVGDSDRARTLRLGAAASAVENFYRSKVVRLIDGRERAMLSSSGASKVAYVDSPWPVNSLSRSSDPAHADWTKQNGITITPAYEAAPDGQLKAARVQLTISALQRYFQTVTGYAGKTMCFSLKMRSLTGVDQVIAMHLREVGFGTTYNAVLRTVTPAFGVFSIFAAIPPGSAGVMALMYGSGSPLDWDISVCDHQVNEGTTPVEFIETVASPFALPDAAIDYEILDLDAPITITEYPLFTCESECEDPVYDESWLFAWQVNAALEAIHDTTCEDPCEDPIRSWGNDLLECVIERAKPAHTYVEFAYS